MRTLVNKIEELTENYSEIYKIGQLLREHSISNSYSVREKEYLTSLSELCNYRVSYKDGNLLVKPISLSSDEKLHPSYPDPSKFKTDIYDSTFDLIKLTKTSYLKIHCFIVYYFYGNRLEYKHSNFVESLLDINNEELEKALTSGKQERLNENNLINQINIGAWLSIAYKRGDKYKYLIEIGIEIIDKKKEQHYWRLGNVIFDILQSNRKIHIDKILILINNLKDYVSLDSHPNMLEQIKICKKLIKSKLISDIEVKQLTNKEIELYNTVIQSEKFQVYAKLEAISECIKYYERTKNVELVLEYKNKFDIEKQNIQMSTVRHELPPEFMLIIKERVKELVSIFNPFEFFFILSMTNTVIDVEMLKNTNNSNTSLLSFAKHIHIDSMKNIRQPKESDSFEKGFTGGLFILGLKLFLYEVFIIHNGNYLNLNSINKFFKTTWYSEPSYLIKNDQSKENLIIPQDFLIPSIKGLITSLNKTKSKDYPKIIVPFIDSLVMKIEFIIRLIVKNNGISTTNVNSGFESSEMTLEQIINVLPYEDFTNLWKGFGSLNLAENDKFILKYLFTKDGLNLRNRIAHGLIDINIYSIDNALLLIYCIIRLAKYRRVK